MWRGNPSFTPEKPELLVVVILGPVAAPFPATIVRKAPEMLGEAPGGLGRRLSALGVNYRCQEWAFFFFRVNLLHLAPGNEDAGREPRVP